MKKYLKPIFIILGIITTEQIIISCAKDDEISITEPRRYTTRDIKSYADMFKLFWTVMDERYNYLYEQKRKDNKDWKAIYNEYYPKFAALKTYNRANETGPDITADYRKAEQYYQEIIDPIIDRHFKVYIEFPTSKNIYQSHEYTGKREVLKGTVFGFNNKFDYMKNKLEDNSVKYLYDTDGMLAGRLKSNPDIYYLGIKRFTMNTYMLVKIPDSNFFTRVSQLGMLTTDAIDKSAELNTIKDINEKKKVRDFTLDILNQWNAFFSSNEVKDLNNMAEIFKTNEVMSDDFLNAAKKVQEKFNNLIKYSDSKNYSSVENDRTAAYIEWFQFSMRTHVNLSYQASTSISEINNIIKRASFYKEFLNPLHRGTIKKIIIDLRDNEGGHVVDGRIMDRFITKNAIMGHQRTKISSGSYRYTPWVPIEVKPAKFGIPGDIPIVVLINRNSGSMSEITTLALKSQGNHVITMGEYSVGGTGGLGGEDKFNGGIKFLGELLESGVGPFIFNMPMMAFKNSNGEVIEGIGIKPDIAIAPPTEEEVSAMKTSPTTFVDRSIKEAVQYLSAK